MFSIAKFTTLVTVLACLTTSTRAQTNPAWNRSVSDVHIVHPPGTPPGTWRVVFTLNIGDQSAPAFSDLSCDVTLYLNAIPIETWTGGVSPQAQVNACNGCISQSCVQFHTNWGVAVTGICSVVSGSCGCGGGVIIDNPTTNWQDHMYLPTDHITIGITASPGSLPEIDTSDDAMTIQVGENNPGLDYCFGDGSLATACPCSNTGAAGHGCANSANSSGAQLAATGFTEVDPLTGTDAVVLHGSGMPSSATAIYLKGNNNNASGVVFGDGVRCVSGTLIRLGVKGSVSGASSFPGPGDPSISVRGATPSGSGLTGYYQMYYRDSGSSCPPRFNTSNGVQISW